jgi:hypothetical protein
MKQHYLKMVILLLVLFLINYSGAQAQSNTTEKHSKKHNYNKDPHWISMMTDPNVNYFEAKKAFNAYWANHELPEEEGEMEGEKEEKERSLVSRLLKSEAKVEAEKMEMKIPFKRFKRWEMEVAPYVQSDGSILSTEEQMKIWEQSRK